jgi:hypothetical protein
VCATVGANVFNQMNPLSFNMPFGGANPLPQVLSLTSTGTNFNFYNASVSTSKGGNWLQLSSTSGVFTTPEAVTVSVNASALPVGSYTGEIIFSEYPNNTMAITIPVTLTITSCGPFFDTLPGLMSYSLDAQQHQPPVPVRTNSRRRIRGAELDAFDHRIGWRRMAQRVIKERDSAIDCDRKGGELGVARRWTGGREFQWPTAARLYSRESMPGRSSSSNIPATRWRWQSR